MYTKKSRTNLRVHESDKGHDESNYTNGGIHHDSRAFNAEINADGDPLTYREATEGPEKAQWKKAMQGEYEAIKRNQIYEAAEAPPDVKPISSKWAYKKKSNPDGSTKYGVRPVIRGIEQTDYGETYGSVSKLTTFRYMIIEAARHGLEVDRLDVVTAFLKSRGRRGRLYGATRRSVRSQHHRQTQKSSIWAENGATAVA